MNRRHFLKTGILGAGTILLGNTLSWAGEIKRDVPIFGPDTKTVGGKKHTPFIKAPKKVKAGEWFDVEVEVGHYHPHPNTKKHFIESISLWIDKLEVASAKFKPVQGAPKARFTIRINKPGKATLRAFGYCNIHGLWVSFPTEIEVV